MRSPVEFVGPAARAAALEVKARVEKIDRGRRVCGNAWAQEVVVPVLEFIDERRAAGVLSKTQAAVLRAVVQDEGARVFRRYVDRLVAASDRRQLKRAGTQDRTALLPPSVGMG